MDKAYYINYYDTKKHIYKMIYERKKIERKAEEELFKPYNGKINYYKMKYIEFSKIKNDM
jgi:hypothetical protein